MTSPPACRPPPLHKWRGGIDARVAGVCVWGGGIDARGAGIMMGGRVIVQMSKINCRKQFDYYSQIF